MRDLGSELEQLLVLALHHLGQVVQQRRLVVGVLRVAELKSGGMGRR